MENTNECWEQIMVWELRGKERGFELSNPYFRYCVTPPQPLLCLMTNNNPWAGQFLMKNENEKDCFGASPAVVACHHQQLTSSRVDMGVSLLEMRQEGKFT